MATSASFWAKCKSFVKHYWHWLVLAAGVLFLSRRKKPTPQRLPESPTAKIAEAAREEIETILKTEPQYDKVVEEATKQAEVKHVENTTSSDPYGNV